MAETTVQQMALTRDTGPGGFMERVTATLAYACNTILNEPGNTPYHPGRAAYAQRVVQMPQQAAMQAGPQVVMGVNVVNATTYDEVTKVATCTIADIDLQSQILTLWNSLAGIDTPS
jgi:hypothetical protein